MISIDEIKQLPTIDRPANEGAMLLQDDDPSGYYDEQTGMRWCCGREHLDGPLYRWPDRLIGIPQRK